MSWLILVISGLLETGWAIGLKESHGFTRPLPTVLTLLGMTGAGSHVPQFAAPM